MHPLADYIPSIIFVAAAIAIPSDVNFEAKEESQSLAIALNEAESNEIALLETFGTEQAIEPVENQMRVAAEIIASSY